MPKEMKIPEWLSDWVNYSMSEWKTINLRTEDFLPKNQLWRMNTASFSELLGYVRRHGMTSQEPKTGYPSFKSAGNPISEIWTHDIVLLSDSSSLPYAQAWNRNLQFDVFKPFFYIVSSHPVWNLFRQILVQYSLPGCHLIKVPIAHGE